MAQKVIEVGSVQSVVDGSQPGRGLRVIVTDVMPKTVGMGDEGGAHTGFL